MPFVLKEHEADPAFIAYIESIRKPLVDSAEGLKADITKLKAKAKDFEGVDVAALKTAKDELDALKLSNQSKETEIEKAMRIAGEQHRADMEALKTAVASLKTQNNVLIVDDAIKNQLIAVNVDPVMIPAALAMIKPLVSVIAVDGIDKAFVGEQNIGEYIASWSKTEIAKRFILAKRNSGGGEIGVTQDSINENAKYFDKKSKSYNLTEQLKIKNSNPALYVNLSK